MATIAKLSVMLSANTAAFTDGLSKSAYSAKKFALDLERQVEEYGVSAFDRMRAKILETFGPEAAAKVDELKSRLDELRAATEAQNAAAEKARVAAANAARAQAAMADEGKRVFESTRTAAERYAAEVAKLDGLLASGAITQDTYSRALKRAQAAMGPSAEALKAQADANNTAAEQARIAAAGKSVFDSTRTAAEKYATEVNRLDGLLLHGAISQNTYNRAVGQLKSAMTPATEATKLNITSLLKGAGAAAGITFAFKKLNHGLDELEPIVTKYASGQMSANEAIEEGTRALARNIPVVGEAFKAGEKLGEMYANLSKDVREFNAEIEKQVAKNAKFAANWKIYEKAAGDATTMLQGLTRELALLQESDAGSKAALQAAFAYEDAMKKAAGLREELAKIAKIPVMSKRKEEVEAQIAAIESTAAAIIETQRKLAQEAKNAPVSQAIQNLVREVEEFGVPAFDKMRKQVLDTFGPDAAAFVDQYKARLDALNEGVKQREAAEQAAEKAADEAARARERLMDAGQSVFEATRTDMEKREAELTRLSDLLNAGAIDWDTYSRAVKQANEALKKTGTMVPENPAAQVVRFTQGMPSGPRPMSELEKINKQQVDLQKKQLDTLKRIDSKTTMSGGGVVIGTEALA